MELIEHRSLFTSDTHCLVSTDFLQIEGDIDSSEQATSEERSNLATEEPSHVINSLEDLAVVLEMQSGNHSPCNDEIDRYSIVVGSRVIPNLLPDLISFIAFGDVTFLEKLVETGNYQKSQTWINGCSSYDVGKYCCTLSNGSHMYGENEWKFNVISGFIFEKEWVYHLFEPGEDTVNCSRFVGLCSNDEDSWFMVENKLIVISNDEDFGVSNDIEKNFVALANGRRFQMIMIDLSFIDVDESNNLASSLSSGMGQLMVRVEYRRNGHVLHQDIDVKWDFKYVSGTMGLLNLQFVQSDGWSHEGHREGIELFVNILNQSSKRKRFVVAEYDDPDKGDQIAKIVKRETKLMCICHVVGLHNIVSDPGSNKLSSHEPNSFHLHHGVAYKMVVDANGTFRDHV